jgi:hypothetical protein
VVFGGLRELSPGALRKRRYVAPSPLPSRSNHTKNTRIKDNVPKILIIHVTMIVLTVQGARPAQYRQGHTCIACKRYCSVSGVRWPLHFLQLLPSHPQRPLHCQWPRPLPRSVPRHQSQCRPPLQAMCPTQRRRSPYVGSPALVGQSRSFQPHSFDTVGVPVRRRLGSFPAWEAPSPWDRAVPTLRMPKQHTS